MSFFSIEFCLLLLGFFVIYWALPLKLQNIALLVFNYLVIYLFSPYFALIVFIYTMLIHFLAHFISTFHSRFALLSSVCVALLFLCFFKYYASIKDEFDALLALLGLNILDIDIIFPLGISFYTFASITYLRAVYEDRAIESNLILLDSSTTTTQDKALQSFVALATYLSFFATFLAGPIMRSEFFFTQYHKQRKFGAIDMIITLVLFGVIKKVFIANYCGIYAEPILKAPFSYHSVELVCAIFAYSVQLYCDFSGYVNLVCAFGLMIGFKLPLNFDMPYLASNLKDFWNRWHISLSHFIRDYIYIPLGGNKRGFINAQIFVLIAFVLSGIWHGNTLNFLFWGLLHGLGIVWLNILRALNAPTLPFINKCITMLYVSVCWLFFYYHTQEELFSYFTALINGFSSPAPSYAWWLLCGFVVAFLCYPLMRDLIKRTKRLFKAIPLLLKPFVIAALFTLIVGFMPAGIPNFIYASF